MKMEYNKGKAALYCRVASAGPADIGAVEIQRDALREFAVRQGYNDFTEYLDNGYGGNDPDRPAFARMDADITAGIIDTVIVRSLDRVARNLRLTEKWIGALEARGVKLIAADGSHKSAAFVPDVIRELMQSGRRKGVYT
jgi:DNA invertase Pin-like site-specific DNA recombinase